MDQAERIAALRGLFACSDAAANALGKAMVFKDMPRKSVLCYQGDRSEHLWLILQGSIQLKTVSIEGQSTVISTFGPGELVGAFPDESEVGFDALTTESAQLLQIGAKALTRLLEKFPDLGTGLASIFAGQLDMVLDRLAARVSLSAKGRFYRELLRAGGESGHISPPPVVAAMALLAQTTQETGSRAISTLEKRGIIERDAEKLSILSQRMLEELIF